MMQKVQYNTVSVDKLRRNPWNSNRVTADNEKKIRESIKRNGIFKPVIVREIEGGAYEIIGGEHRWEQARELGYTEIPIVNLGAISDAKAKEIGIIDNARYGVDDTLLLGDILKDIEADDLQDFLPYGSADLDAIFSSSDIAIEDLEIDEAFEKEENNTPEEDVSAKPAKTHTVMRFKLSLGDAERLTALVAQTQTDHDFTKSDDLTNAGDALVHLLSEKLGTKTDDTSEE